VKLPSTVATVAVGDTGREPCAVPSRDRARPASAARNLRLPSKLLTDGDVAVLAVSHAGCNTFPMSASVLDREMLTEAEAARLLRVPQRTLNYWLEGGEVRGRVYRPVIRTEPRGRHAAVTWAEFV
jgi:hypothetical protein